MQLLNDAGHVPVFAALTWLAANHLARRIGAPLRGAHYLALFVGVVATGVTMEAIQYFTGRDAEVGDVITDALSAACVLCLLARRSIPKRKSITRLALLAGALVAVAVLVAPLARGALAYAARSAAFPDLSDFSKPLSLYFVQGLGTDVRVARLPDPWTVVTHAPALRVEVTNPDTPAVVFFEPVADWRAYHRLELEVVSPSRTPLLLVLRIDDAQHNQEPEDRFNRAFEIAPPGRHVISVSLDEVARAPRGRRMDLGHIARVVVFDASRRTPAGTVFYLTRIHLE
jgi:hypothetical protein